MHTSTNNIINIFNCYGYGNVPINGGGICGKNYNNTIIVTNCYHFGDISMNGGGICGMNMNGYITNCYNIGNMDVSSGGMCGINMNGYVTNCYNISDVSGRLIGHNSNVNIKYCYNSSSWSNYNNVLKMYIKDINFINIDLTNITEPIWTNIDISNNTMPYYLTSFNKKMYNSMYMNDSGYIYYNITSNDDDYYNGNYSIVCVDNNINKYNIDMSNNIIIFNDNRLLPMSICIVGKNNINMSYSINTFTYILHDNNSNVYMNHNNNPLTILYVSHEDNSLYLSMDGFVNMSKSTQQHIDNIIENNNNIGVIVDRILNDTTFPYYVNIIINKN